MIQSQLKKSNLFLYLILLTTIFIVFEIIFFLHWTSAYLGDYKLIADQLVFPKVIIPDIAIFLLIQLGLHLFYVIAICAVSLSLGRVLSLNSAQTETMGLILWVLGILTVLLANQHFYPNSKFAEMLTVIVPFAVGSVLLTCLMMLIAIVAGIATVGLFLEKTKIKVTGLLLLGLVLIFYNYEKNSIAAKHTVSTSADKPNIIIIGIDSVRPDFLGFFGGEKQTPHLDNFLNRSTVFADAMTPLASTFPAWVSILTGEYPKHNGARTILADQTRIDMQHTIPALLKKQGYQTIFATDETRFSNIDRNFGFDHIIAPPIGINDFLLGTLNDFPLSNLIINTALGRYLFPYSYANRGVFAVYDPDTFIQLMTDHFKKIDQRPLFLAVHFCLPHFPYTWGTQLAAEKPVQNYQYALRRVDQQFFNFMQLLTVNNVLDNSIVIVLSDHGEAMELQGDRATDANLFISEHKGDVFPRFYPPSWDNEQVNQSGGHGTDVLGLTQYHVLLAFQFRGFNQNKIIRIPNQVSLLDIKPTLLSILKIADSHIDGHSLLKALQGEFQTKGEQDFIMESSFSPAAVRSVHPETKAVLFQGIKYFEIDPVSTRMVVKKDMNKLIISSKQLADMHGNWILALYPQSPHSMIPILLNLRTGEWTNDLHTAFALQAPVKHMLAELKNFYKDEIGAEIMSR